MLPQRAIVACRPYVTTYDRVRKSEHSFDVSYGYFASSGVTSVYGSVSASPYALSDDATTMRRTDSPIRRHASSTVYVPRTLDSKVSYGSRRAAPTCVCAARWNTVSQPW